MVRSIIDSTIGGETEVRRWYEEGKTYSWMVDEYARRYDLQVSPTMFSNRRAKRGWPRRIARDDSLIPWEVKDEHRWHRYLVLLRFEARRRSGLELRERDLKEVTSFINRLAEANAVIHYDPDTDEGFFAVPREAGDTDIIRRPVAGRTQRHSTD